MKILDRAQQQYFKKSQCYSADIFELKGGGGGGGGGGGVVIGNCNQYKPNGEQKELVSFALCNG